MVFVCIIAYILSGIIAIFTFFIFLLLVVPFNIEAEVANNDVLHGHATVSWLLGLTSVGLDYTIDQGNIILKLARLSVYRKCAWPLSKEEKEERKEKKETKRLKTEEKKAAKKEKKEKKKEKKPKESAWEKTLRVYSNLTPQLFQELIRYFIRIVRSLKIRAKVSGRFGFENPADTGVVFGFIQAVKQPMRFKAVDIQPIFDDTGVWGSAKISARFWFIQIIFETLKFAFKKCVRRLWMQELKILVFERR